MMAGKEEYLDVLGTGVGGRTGPSCCERCWVWVPACAGTTEGATGMAVGVG